MKKIAIVQLNRLGDIIQTLQAIDGLGTAQDIEFTLICRDSFVTPIQDIVAQYAAHIVKVDLKKLVNEDNLPGIRKSVSDFVTEVNNEKYDLVINLTFDKTSSYLTSLIDSTFTLGLYRNERNELAINGKWAQYVYSNIMGSSYASFNLVDIFKKIIGNHAVIPTTVFRPDSNIVVIHPFASNVKKQWKVSKWVEVIYNLTKSISNVEVFIVGSKADLVKAKMICDSPILSKSRDRVNIWAGNKNINDVNELLQKARLFIGNDSMVSHLAALHRVPSTIISLGPVKPYETTPYNQNVINIAANLECFPCTIEKKCELLPCHNKIHHDVVSTVAKKLYECGDITEEDIKRSLPETLLSSVSIYKNTDISDGLIPEQIISQNLTFDDTCRKLYRIIWSFYFENNEPNFKRPTISLDSAERLQNTMTGLANIYELYNFAVKFANRIITEADTEVADIECIKESVQRLAEVDKLLMKTQSTFPEISPIVSYFHVAKSNVQGNNIIEISKNNLVLYYEAANITAAMHDLCDKMLAPYRVSTTNEKASDNAKNV